MGGYSRRITRWISAWVARWYLVSKTKGWGYGSVVESSPNTYESLLCTGIQSSIPVSIFLCRFTVLVYSRDIFKPKQSQCSFLEFHVPKDYLCITPWWYCHSTFKSVLPKPEQIYILYIYITSLKVWKKNINCILFNNVFYICCVCMCSCKYLQA